MTSLSPFRLKPLLMGRIWGRKDLSPWFVNDTGEVIGEAWLTGPKCVVQDGPLAGKTLGELSVSEGDALLGGKAGDAEFPVLLKLLFPKDWLSVQVHPNDEQAASLRSKGKTECWYIVDAEPGATVAVGFKNPEVTPDEVRAAIEAKSLESLLHYEPVAAGDMVFVDANTVHAIGPGITVFEIQQTSDITYRMYDYGRPRELHLDAGLTVMKGKTRAGKVAPVEKGGYTQLIREQYFATDRFELADGESVVLSLDAAQGPHALVLLSGSATVEAENSAAIEMAVAEAVVVPASVSSYVVRAKAKTVFFRATA